MIRLTTTTGWDGATEQDVTVTYWDGSAEQDVLSVGVVHSGYPSVAAMTAQAPFYVAHRGGSADWPEMSLYAYTQSVAWGAPALEFSTARTSDGVWFGLHDQTLDRTSGTSGKVAANMTWAEVQSYSINQYGRSEPYLRLDELLTLYGQSHLVFIDPKYATAYAPELFALVKSFPGGADSVMKGFYSGVSFADKARAAGFKTWGYYYEADADHISETHAHWDLLGMDYTASTAAWNLALAPGKPVIGHICPTAAAASTALGKGAAGLMCSGVAEIVPGPKIFD